MNHKHSDSNAGRVHIPELASALYRQSREDTSMLMTAGVPFTMRPLVPEDLGTVARKGRTDLVKLTDRSGVLKMTRTLDAEMRRVRSAR
jgi:hypothetical protein